MLVDSQNTMPTCFGKIKALSSSGCSVCQCENQMHMFIIMFHNLWHIYVYCCRLLNIYHFELVLIWAQRAHRWWFNFTARCQSSVLTVCSYLMWCICWYNKRNLIQNERNEQF